MGIIGRILLAIFVQGKASFLSTGAGNGPPPTSTLDLLYSPPRTVFPSQLHHTPRPSLFSAQRLSLVERGACRCSVATRVLCPVSHPPTPLPRTLAIRGNVGFLAGDGSESKKNRSCMRNIFGCGRGRKHCLLHPWSSIGHVEVETAHAAPGSSLNVSRNSNSLPTKPAHLICITTLSTCTLHLSTTLLTALKLMSVARPTATFAPS